jgi:hypothetical protein
MDLNDCSGPSDLTSSSSVISDHTSDYAYAGAADSADFDGMQTHADVPQLIRQAVALYVSNAVTAARASGSAEHLFAVRTVLETRDLAAILKATPEYAFLAERCDPRLLAF